MSEPDETMVEAVAMAIRDERGALDVDADGIPDSQWRALARAALSVPVVRDALARDAQVREIVAAHDGLVLDRAIGFGRLVALYPSPGDRDDSEERN